MDNNTGFLGGRKERELALSCLLPGIFKIFFGTWSCYVVSNL
jgi:hypothetical protein